jgi:hypothetical protein
MKNITVTVDDDTYRRARVVAAERDTSVSALVKKFLSELRSASGEFDLLRRLDQLRELVPADFRASDRLSRDELHDRGNRKA